MAAPSSPPEGASADNSPRRLRTASCRVGSTVVPCAPALGSGVTEYGGGVLQMASVTRWWWLRHAPTDAPDGLLVGRLDLPALLAGAQPRAPDDDVQAMAACLPRNALWVCSPLRRARDTSAALFAAGIKPTPELLEPAFAEQTYGLWDGLTYEQIGERYPSESEQLWRTPATMRPPEGESFADVMVRVAEAITRLGQAHPNRDIVAVAHSGTIRAALALALDLSPDAALRLQIAPLSLTRIDRVHGANEGWRIEAVNLPGL